MKASILLVLFGISLVFGEPNKIGKGIPIGLVPRLNCAKGEYEGNIRGITQCVNKKTGKGGCGNVAKGPPCSENRECGPYGLCLGENRFSKRCYCFKTKKERNQASRPLEPIWDTKHPSYDSDSAMEENFAKEMPFAIPEE